MNYNYNPYYRPINIFTMQTQITSFLTKEEENLDKYLKKIISKSNRLHNNGTLKCQYCKRQIYFTDRFKQKNGVSATYDFVEPKESFKNEKDYYSMYNCVLSCYRCYKLKEKKSYKELVDKLYQTLRHKLDEKYETPMILD